MLIYGNKKKQLNVLHTDNADARKNLEILRSKIDEHNSKASAYSKKIQDSRGAIEKLQESIRAIEQKESTMQTRCTVLSENFTERYGEMLATYLTQEEYKSITEASLVSKNIPNKLQEAKDHLKKLGGVNLLAPDEFRQVDTRYEFLTGQLADLEEAEGDLQQVITEIEKESRQKLECTYAEVRKHFKRLFTKLMDGGVADIILVDSDDILTAGLDIVAQPPEKKTKHLSQLSGGERAMVSLALLFSLHSVRPAPFCMLDELDAPLDDQNIGRFLSLLDDFATNTQFIIISHNKRTIAYGKQLIGVTMEERGVSKIIGVRTEQ